MTLLEANRITWQRQRFTWLGMVAIYIIGDALKGRLSWLSVILSLAAVATAHVIFTGIYYLVNRNLS